MSKTQDGFLVPVRLNRKLFLDFATFDSIVLPKAWKKPLIFGVIFTVFSVVCFCLQSYRHGAALLGVVMLVIGLGLPLVYFGSFYATMNARAKAIDRTRNKIVYTITVVPDGIHATNGEVTHDYKWEELHAAYRVNDCIYLYHKPGRAYLLPEGQCKTGTNDDIWSVIAAGMPADKAVNRKK